MSADRERAKRVREVFDELVDLPTGERAARLSRIASEVPDVAGEVELLLQHDSDDDPIREAVGIIAAAYREPQETKGSTIGPYRLVRELGRGGMGTVWLAMRDDDAYQARVAIKLLRGATDPQLRARFRAERQILATFEHPNIARLLDGGTTPDGSPYVVMEYVHGEPIDVYCDRRALALDRRLELFCQVCAAVQYAHRHLTVHRDLKPTNILVDGEGVPKLLDFGIAKLLDASDPGEARPDTRTGSQLLTPHYASPEQIRGEPISTATDVYSLGVLLHRLLTGGIPYRLSSPDPMELARAVCEQDPVPPSVSAVSSRAGASGSDVPRTDLARRLEGDLDNIVGKALRKEPRHRYGSPEDLADDLRRHLARRPVVARPATLRYRLERFVSRHRWRLAIAGGTAALLIAATAFSFSQMRSALQARAFAERERSVAVGQAVRATLSAASTRLEAQEPLAVRALLESVAEAERGWEWRYLESELERPIMLVAAAEAVSAALPPGGRTVVTVTPSGLVEWRALLEGSEVRTARLELSPPVRHAAFSSDGVRLAVAVEGASDRVSVWDLEERSGPTRVFEDSVAGRVTGIALSAEGQDVIATTADATWVWRQLGAAPVRLPHGTEHASVTVSAHGGSAALLGPEGDGSYRILDADRPELGESAMGRDVIGMALSPDGGLTATGETDRAVRLREAVSGRVVARLMGHTGRPDVLTFGADGRWLASAAPNDVRVWDVERGTPLAVFAGPSEPKELRFSLDGTLLVAVSEGGEVRVWRTQPESSSMSGASAMAYSADGSMVWAVSSDGVLRALDHASGELFDVVNLGLGDVTALASSSNDRWIATLHGGVAMVREAVMPARGEPLDTGPSPVVAMAFAPSHPIFATLDATGRVTTWDVETWTPMVRMGGPPAPEGTVTFSPDGSRLVTTHTDGARLWDASAGRPLRVVTDADRTPTAAAYQPHGGQLAVGWSDGSIGLLDLRTGGTDGALAPHHGAVTALAYTPDGRRLASGAEDGSIWVSDPHRSSSLLDLRGHAFRVRSLGYSRDGTKLLSTDGGGLLGGNLRVWDSGAALERLRAAERLALARREVGPSLSEMLARSPDAHAVAAALRGDDSLGDVDRRAALQVALDPPLPDAGVVRDPFDGFAFESTSLDSYVRVGSHPSLRMTDRFTVEAWVQPLASDGEAADPGIIVNKEGEYQIARFADGELAWIVAGPDGWLLPWRRARYRIPVSTWSHVALVRDGEIVRFHVNGRVVQAVRIPEAMGDHHPSMDELRIMGRQHTPASMRGRIDEVRIWEVARSEVEIRRAMRSRMARAEPGLLAAWSFDEGEGRVAGDATGRHPAELVGGSWSATRR